MGSDSSASSAEPILSECPRNEILGASPKDLRASLFENDLLDLEEAVSRRLALLTPGEQRRAAALLAAVLQHSAQGTWVAARLAFESLASIDPLLAALAGVAGGLTINVAGNLAYDGLKAAGKRFRDRRRRAARSPPPLTARELELLDHLAVYATIQKLKDQCLADKLEHVPKHGDFTVGRWAESIVRGFPCQQAEVRSQSDSSFVARVSVPLRRTEERGVEVLITKAA